MLKAGQTVYINGLLRRTDLNNKLCELVRWHVHVGRWEILLHNCGERILVRSENIVHDHYIQLLGTLNGHKIDHCIWIDGDNHTGSARAAVVELCGNGGRFCGSAFFRRMGYEDCHRVALPAILPLLEKHDTFWNALDIINILAPKLAPGITRIERWDDSGGLRCMFANLKAVHANPGMFLLAVRTAANTETFTRMQIMCELNEWNISTRPKNDTVVIEPASIMAFHKDNLVKIYKSRSTIDQAMRKICEMVDHGCEGQLCPVCLEDMTPNPGSRCVFMPCECKVSIHAACFEKIRDSGHCPVCRGEFAMCSE